MDFLLNMSAGQFIILFWVLVGLYAVLCVLDGLASSSDMRRSA